MRMDDNISKSDSPFYIASFAILGFSSLTDEKPIYKKGRLFKPLRMGTPSVALSSRDEYHIYGSYFRQYRSSYERSENREL